jgi:signal transduction histidine kinase/tetratricopeptide (TPR) repeat protein
MADFTPLPGRPFGRWTPHRQLGRGSFGAAWYATDPEGRVGALKILSEDPGDEVRALAMVCHPSIPTLLDSGTWPAPFVVMELMRGRTLGALLRAEAVDLDLAIDVAANVADALATVHHTGLHHGDVKPDNILVAQGVERAVSLVDFGLALRGGGGTLRYASPEALIGNSRGTAADVYSLGLVLWEMLHRRRAWSELDLGQSLIRRRMEVPPVEVGPPWLRRLTEQMLAIDPAHRPSAADVADALSAHGAHTAEPGPDLLRRRARVVHVPLAGVDDALLGWVSALAGATARAPTAVSTGVSAGGPEDADGGRNLALIGGAGAGRTHQIDRLVRELRVRGIPVVRLAPADEPWASVSVALSDPSLPEPPVALPTIADPLDRAEAAAEALEARGNGRLVVVVDDEDTLDPSARLLVSALVRHRVVYLCSAGAAPPEWAARLVRLRAFDAAELADLTRQILGPDLNLGPLITSLQIASGGVPDAAVAFIVAAGERGALLLRRQRWLVDEGALQALVHEGSGAAGADVSLPTDAALLGAFLAVIGRPTRRESLLASAPLPFDRAQAALPVLLDSGLVRLDEHTLLPRSAAAVARLRALSPDLPALHRHCLLTLRSQPEVPYDRLGRHIVGAGDAVEAARLGAQVIAAVAALDPAEAARIADGLWGVAPVPELALARARALVGAGRTEEGFAAAEQALAGREHGPDDVGLLTLQADVHRAFHDDGAAALASIVAAHAALGGAPPTPSLRVAEANVHFAAGRVEEAIRVARPFAEAEPPEAEEDLEQWLRLRGIWAQSTHKAGDTAGAIAILELPDLGGRGGPARALLEGMRGRLLLHAGRIREAAAVMQSAARVETGLSVLDRARMMNNWGLASYSAGDRQEALGAWEDALLLFERIQSPLEQIRVSINLCVGYQEGGRWERARQVGQWAHDEATRRGHPDLVAIAAGNLGDVFLGQGAYEEAEALFARGARLADELGMASELVELARRDAELAVLREEEGSLVKAERALRLAGEQGMVVEECRSHALIAVCLARRGRLNRVDRHLGLAVAPLREAGAAGELARVRLWAAEAYLAAGRTRDAAAECDRVSAYAQEAGLLPLRTRADHLLALARAGSPESLNGRLEELLALAVAMTRERDLPTLLQGIAGAALTLLQADRAFVVLGTAEAPEIAAGRVRDGVDAGLPAMSIVRRVMRQAREVLAADIGERGDLRAAESVLALHLRSAMCVPLVEGRETVGAIYVDSRMESEEELTEAAKLLRALASHAAAAVTNARRVAALADRTDRVAELAHDIRNPLSALIVIARNLARRDLAPTVVEAELRKLDELSRDTMVMLDQIVEPVAVPVAVVELDRLVAHVGDMLAVEARSRGVALDIDIEEGLPAVQGNTAELFRAWSNIVSNAIKYSPAGGRVSVRLRVAGGELVGVVEDQGPGIPEDQLEAVFRRGVQAPGALGGHGLGLAIASRVASEHGGRLVAENRAEGGARLVLTLPLERRPPPPVAANPSIGGGTDDPIGR